MRRTAPAGRSGAKTGDIRKDFSAEQLANFGAAVLAFNESEWMIDMLLVQGLHLNGLIWRDVVTRFQGSIDKVDVIKLVMIHVLKFTGEELEIIRDSLGQFLYLKTYRDSLAHARVFNRNLGIGEVTNKKNNVYEILLTAEALDVLYQRISALNSELNIIFSIFCLQFQYSVMTSEAKERYAQMYKRDPSLPPPGQDLQRCFDLLRSHRTKRESLPLLPEFPA